jgi:3-isopropylmalate/(R)-2-methylmalate dehydratase large subunit
MGKTLYDKVFDLHILRSEGDDHQIFVDLHLLHEATSAPAFGELAERNLPVRMPSRAFATVDHVIPTRPGDMAQGMELQMQEALRQNTAAAGIRFFSPNKKENGIVHVVGPEQGLTQPGMVIVCGDSHTSTHGAFGAIALGIGTSQIRDVLATQSLLTSRLPVKRIEIAGALMPGVSAKDVVLYVISRIGVRAGQGHAFEFCGSAVKAMSMEQRMTLCNMAVEAGARVGYVNPDETTFEYLRKRSHAPADFDAAVQRWMTFGSDADASFAETLRFSAEDVAPMVTWGIHPGQALPVDGIVPASATDQEARDFMGWNAGDRLTGRHVDVVFIGSCTNGRLSDLAEAAEYVRSCGGTKARHVRALVVPGSWKVHADAEALGYADVFRRAGFEFRNPGCSMCLAMNDDRLADGELCVSTSNRNFKGRQGAARGRTVLASPLTAAAAAMHGRIVDIRKEAV